jgi:hypothetical protein
LPKDHPLFQVHQIPVLHKHTPTPSHNKHHGSRTRRFGCDQGRKGRYEYSWQHCKLPHISICTPQDGPLTATLQVGGLTNTVGGVLGATGRGLGETVSGATGGAGKDVGKGIADVGDGVQDGTGRVAKGAKDAGEWKS